MSTTTDNLTTYQRRVLFYITRSRPYPLTIWYDDSNNKGAQTQGMHNAGVTAHMALALKRKEVIEFESWPDEKEIKRGKYTYRLYRIVPVTEPA